MTQEERELLLKDLSTRWPYGVKGIITYDRSNTTFTVEGIDNDVLHLSDAEECHIEDFKSYLCPMSSMTEKEKEELKELCSVYIPTDSKNIGFEDYGILVFTHHLTDNSYSFKLNLNVIDWLNKHNFDYRGLIEKGLALEALEGMYEY